MASIVGEPVGRVFSRYPVEHFIANKPGFSNFTYYSLNGESFFMNEGPSKDSHWTPLPEQMKSFKTITNFGTGHHAKFIVCLDNNSTPFLLFPSPHFLKLGNRWIEVEGGWVDLDACKFIIKTIPDYQHGNYHTVMINRDLVKTWE